MHAICTSRATATRVKSNRLLLTHENPGRCPNKPRGSWRSPYHVPIPRSGGLPFSPPLRLNNSHSIQTQAEPVRHHYTDGRFQRRNGHPQERQIQRLGVFPAPPRKFRSKGLAARYL
ncbi:MAG: hypothetical protein BJ554DRAFT_1010 [Olpidium bornovanus]|uniref:Uncharacterized protein n=1 Tax=Olpidium bornovanus TaxID=278681 RepID=A0A8H7ZSN4_9FUNG|nr:MAG: hypothetical protein BJ554DRAFT_1010 [Olpidium bornovanus]